MPPEEQRTVPEESPLVFSQMQRELKQSRLRKKDPNPIRAIEAFYLVCLALCISVFGLAHLPLPANVPEPFEDIKKIREVASRFITVAHGDEKTGLYYVGKDDAYLCFFIFFFLFPLRWLTMDFVLRPLGISLGVRGKKNMDRFVEQSWIFLYYVLSFSIGFSVYYNSDFFFDLRECWRSYPQFYITYWWKIYYCVQVTFWFHSIFVLHMEAKRKDHFMMLTHHITTIALTTMSYYFHFNKIGTTVLVNLDLCDVLLPLAKLFRYIGKELLCNITFVVFFLLWIVTRQIFFPMIVWSVYYDTIDLMQNKWAPSEGYFWGTTYKGFVLVLFLVLLVLCCVWFYMICRILLRALRGSDVEDSRSDSEDEDGERRKGGPRSRRPRSPKRRRPMDEPKKSK